MLTGWIITVCRRAPAGLRAFLLIPACLLLASCLLLGETSENSLTIYTARDRNLVESVLDKFENQHPQYAGHVAVVYLGAQEAAERVRAESVNPQADIWWGGTQQQFEQASDARLLAAAPSSVAARIPAGMRDPGGTWLGEVRLAEVIAYNHDLLDASEVPATWDELIEPRFQGRILIRDVESSGTMRSIFASLIDRQIRKAGSDAEGFRWLGLLDANTKAYAANPTDLFLRLSRGEAALTLWNLQDVLLQKERRNAPLSVAVPAEGVPILVDGIAKIRNAPSPEAADAFLEFLFSEPIQAKLANEFFQLPVDWRRANANERAWIDRWSATVKRRGRHAAR